VAQRTEKVAREETPMPTLAQLTTLERGAAQTFAARVRARFGSRVTDLRAFGSRCRGEASVHSDLDVLVLLDQITWQERHEISDIGVDLMLELDLPFEVAPTVLTQSSFQRLLSLERLFPQEVERDGIPL
jgi:predicted nucleotidyltransferase